MNYTQLYYIANRYGFVSDVKEDGKVFFSKDAREALPFNSWLEADNFAKAHAATRYYYYAILGTCQ